MQYEMHRSPTTHGSSIWMILRCSNVRHCGRNAWYNQLESVPNPKTSPELDTNLRGHHAAIDRPHWHYLSSGTH